MSSILFRGGIVVGAKKAVLCDVLVREGKVVKIARGISEMGVDRVIDCRGKSLLPGFIDPHVHFRTPGEEYKETFESGSSAAAAGGFTTVFDMPNTVPAVTTRDIFEQKKVYIQGKSVVNYGLNMGATYDAVTGATNVEEFLASDAKAYKIYMGQSTGGLLVDDDRALEEIFSKVAAAKRVVCVHAESQLHLERLSKKYAREASPLLHGKIRSEAGVIAAVKKALELAVKYGTRLHLCHVSTAKEVALLKQYKSKKISSEVTPHHLGLWDIEMGVQANFAKVNPPLRSDKDRRVLIQALQDGVISMVATDHAPHTMEEKEQPYGQAPSGVPGLETALPAVFHSGGPYVSFSLVDMVRVFNDEPARVFELSSKRGIHVGGDADLVVVEYVQHLVEHGGMGARFTRCGWSPFAGKTFGVWPIMTMVGGEIVYENQKVHAIRVGQYLGHL